MLNLRNLFVAAMLITPPAPAFADVIADWNDKAAAFLAEKMVTGHLAERTMAMVHLAMFDTVNAIEPRYRPFLIQPQASPALPKDVAAAAAAGTVLAGLYAPPVGSFKDQMAAYLEAISDDEAKSQAIALGEAVAANILAARAGDGSAALDSYRPKTKPGVYVSTAPMVASMAPELKPFAIPTPSHFRPKPPIALTSEQWAADYNEIKSLGARNSDKRSPKQTEDARFWLMTGPIAYYPVVRQIAAGKKLGALESARFFALVSIARMDALIAVYDAKYHYEFWRPVTAIRNGDIDENSATERQASWQPIADTPMHPEYPCAHCIVAGALESVVESVFGSTEISEVTSTSLTAPGVTHRWTSVRALTDEVSGARIWAGFHYRFSTQVGGDIGRKIGRYVADNMLQPAALETTQK
jgi:hypothetical protein